MLPPGGDRGCARVRRNLHPFQELGDRLLLDPGQCAVRTTGVTSSRLRRLVVRSWRRQCAARIACGVSSTREMTMVRKILALGLLAMSLAAPGAYAQTPPAGAAAPAANAVDPASIQALKDMGAYLQTLKRFHVATEVTGERVLADGQKLQHTATANDGCRASEQDTRIDAQRPLRARDHLRRQDGHALHAGAEVLLDGRVHRDDRRADRQAGGAVRRRRFRCRISSSSARRRRRSTRSSRR